MTVLDERLERLRRATQLLAAPATEQVQHLRDLGVLPSADELALEFDDSYAPSRARIVPVGLQRALAAVDHALEVLSQHDRSELWTERGLRSAPEWENVRTLARDALAAWADDDGRSDGVDRTA